VTPAERFVAECVQAVKGAVLERPTVDLHLVAWASERRLRSSAVRVGLAKALVAAGGVERAKPQRWEGLAVLPITDSGYRSRTRAALAGGPAVDPMPGLLALAEAGIVTDPRALDVAYLRLSRVPRAVTCRACGVITRHVEEGKHVGC
jgi:hypothetical protein